MRPALLALGVILIGATLPLQGMTAAVQRLWLPAHYHAPPATPAHTTAVSSHHVFSASPTLAVAVAVKEVGEHQQPQHDPDKSTVHAEHSHHHSPRSHHHPHTASDAQADHANPHRHLPHGHPHTASAPTQGTAHAPSVSPEALAREKSHDHATLGRHRHDPAEPDVIYVEYGDAFPPAIITRLAGFDSFWTLMPMPLPPVATAVKAGPPSLVRSLPFSHPSSAPRRPPRR